MKYLLINLFLLSVNKVMYFDSFGNLQPPTDLMKYLGADTVEYNPIRYQEYNTVICGHLCLEFLAGQL